MKVVHGLILVAVLMSASSAVTQDTVIVRFDAPPINVASSGSSLGAKAKFGLFIRNTAVPGAFLGAGLEAALSQRSHDNLGFGQEAGGFGARYGAALADRATFNAFTQFLIPSLLHQDPRFHPLRKGSFPSRAGNAIGSAFATRTDAGARTFNASVVLGSFASGVLSNAYYPASERGGVFTIRSSALNLGGVIGTRLAREFWPDIKRKLLHARLGFSQQLVTKR